MRRRVHAHRVRVSPRWEVSGRELQEPPQGIRMTATQLQYVNRGVWRKWVAGQLCTVRNVFNTSELCA